MLDFENISKLYQLISIQQTIHSALFVAATREELQSVNCSNLTFNVPSATIFSSNWCSIITQACMIAKNPQIESVLWWNYFQIKFLKFKTCESADWTDWVEPTNFTHFQHSVHIEYISSCVNINLIGETAKKSNLLLTYHASKYDAFEFRTNGVFNNDFFFLWIKLVYTRSIAPRFTLRCKYNYCINPTFRYPF